MWLIPIFTLINTFSFINIPLSQIFYISPTNSFQFKILLHNSRIIFCDLNSSSSPVTSHFSDGCLELLSFLFYFVFAILLRLVLFLLFFDLGWNQVCIISFCLIKWTIGPVFEGKNISSNWIFSSFLWKLYLYTSIFSSIFIRFQLKNYLFLHYNGYSYKKNTRRTRAKRD